MSEQSPGLKAIIEERHRQITSEGWTPEHDDQHQDGELAMAAAWYIDPTLKQVEVFEDCIEFNDPFPFDEEWKKPKSRWSNLKRAGALIAAEMDLLARYAEANGGLCEACGDAYFPDHNNGGDFHAECCGPEGFTDSDGNPLPAGSPTPEPSTWRA